MTPVRYIRRALPLLLGMSSVLPAQFKRRKRPGEVLHLPLRGVERFVEDAAQGVQRLRNGVPGLLEEPSGVVGESLYGRRNRQGLGGLFAFV
jgi:hypothetical protein